MTPRVALVATTTADASGALLAAQLRFLGQRGWEARLLGRGERWWREPALREPALREQVVLARRRRGGFDWRLRRLAPDLVHFHSGWAAWKSLRTMRQLPARVVISFREDGQDLDLPDPSRLLERADLLLFAHGAALERAVALGWPRDRARVLHSPVLSLGVKRNGAENSAELRLLSAGSVIWEQGFEHSVHAVALLRDAGVPCSYRIVGAGDHLAAVAFARHQLGVTARVELVAPDGSDQLARELGRADVFVDPAVTDTTSPAALEAALASGLPVVASDGEHRQLAGAGITVPRRDPHALAGALERLARDPGLRARLGQVASDVEAPLGAHLGRLEHLYREVLATAP